MNTLSPTHDHGTKPFQSIEPTPADVDWCSRFDDYEDIITLSNHEAYEDGGFWFPCSISICDELKYIKIQMRPGSDEHDLKWAERQVKRIRAGHYREFPWVTVVPSGMSEQVQRVVVGYNRRKLDIRDWATRGGGNKLISCDNPYCEDFEKIHTYIDDDPETVFHYAKDGSAGVRWTINIEKNGHKPWRLYVNCDEDLTPDQARAFANDLNWLAAETDKLNRLEACN